MSLTRIKSIGLLLFVAVRLTRRDTCNSSERMQRDAAETPPPAAYANHFEIAYNQLEFLLDFAQVYQDSGPPKPFARIATSPTYVLALLHLLMESIQRYELSYGRIPEIAERHDT